MRVPIGRVPLLACPAVQPYWQQAARGTQPNSLFIQTKNAVSLFSLLFVNSEKGLLP
jgi:hypothetical protein